jgi:hypothetical protein
MLGGRGRLRGSQNTSERDIVTSLEDRKRAAAARAVEFRAGGDAARPRHRLDRAPFIELLGMRVQQGLSVIAVPTSEATRAYAAPFGIPVSNLDETPELDPTVDGADEIAPDPTVVKGGGRALLCEKIAAAASARVIVIGDDTKSAPVLGRFPLPIEVVPCRSASRRRAGRSRRLQRPLDVRAPGSCGALRRAILSSRMVGTTCSMPRLGVFLTPKRWPQGSQQFRAWSSTGFSFASRRWPSSLGRERCGSSRPQERQK